MSSSSDSDSEEDERLREAVDSNLMKDSMFDPAKKTNSEEEKKPAQNNSSAVSLKSERHIDFSDDHENSLFVSKSMQDHIWKKLLNLIDSRIVYVEPSDTDDDEQSLKKKKRKKVRGGVRLLSGFDEYINAEDPSYEPIVQIKPTIGRKQVEKLELNSNEMLAQCAIDHETIISAKETVHWKRPKHEKVTHFREKNKVLYLVEPPSEFTKIRNKNQWAESKIKRKAK